MIYDILIHMMTDNGRFQHGMYIIHTYISYHIYGIKRTYVHDTEHTVLSNNLQQTTNWQNDVEGSECHRRMYVYMVYTVYDTYASSVYFLET